MTRKALILTNSDDVTSDYLCEQLTAANVAHDRIDTDQLLHNVELNITPKDCVLSIGHSQSICPKDISVLILRRPKPLVALVQGDEYQKRHASGEWSEAIEGFLSYIPNHQWINHPARNFLASHKIEQLTRANAAGLNVPQWIVTSHPQTAKTFFKTVDSQLICKPLSSGFIERDKPENDTLIYTSEIKSDDIGLFERLPVCPVLFQERVVKNVDIRLVVVAEQMTAVSLQANGSDGKQRLDIRRNAMCDVRYGHVEIPDCVKRGVKRMMKEYGLVFAAFDFAINDQGEWVFFEVNPNGQWAWLDLEAETTIGEMFINTIRAMQ